MEYLLVLLMACMAVVDGSSNLQQGCLSLAQLRGREEVQGCKTRVLHETFFATFSLVVPRSLLARGLVEAAGLLEAPAVAGP